MTSPMSLVDLANHLHKLESSVTKILIESAVKLGKLTDLNLFVVVESQDGRKFGGSRELCDAYVNASLRPVGGDVRLHVNDCETVSEERINALYTEGSSSAAHVPFVSTNGLPQQQQQHPSTLPRSVPPSTSTSLLTAFSVSPISGLGRKRGSSQAASVDQPLASTSVKVRRLNDASLLDDDDDEDDSRKIYKPEMDCLVVSDDENDAIDAFLPFDRLPLNDTQQSGSSLNVDSTMAHGGTFVPIGGGVETSAQTMDDSEDWRCGGNKMFINSSHPPIVLSDNLCHKMRGLQSINNRNLFDKSASEYRLFASTVYDFGKHIYAYAPPQKDVKDLNVLAFITECVESFLKQHPYLAECETRECKVNGLTITGFLRDRVKGGFKKLMHSRTRTRDVGAIGFCT